MSLGGILCMFSKVLSAAIDGARCVPVSVEVDASNGLPAFLMVGDLSYQVKEAQESPYCDKKQWNDNSTQKSNCKFSTCGCP